MSVKLSGNWQRKILLLSGNVLSAFYSSLLTIIHLLIHRSITFQDLLFHINLFFLCFLLLLVLTCHVRTIHLTRSHHRRLGLWTPLSFLGHSTEGPPGLLIICVMRKRLLKIRQLSKHIYTATQLHSYI